MQKLNNLVVLADNYYAACTLQKFAFIKKLPSGKWQVLSEKGKNLGIFDSKEKARKRLQQVEFFKFKGKKHASEDPIDLTEINDLSYSAIMRNLRKECDPQTVKEFLAIYKTFFDILTEREVKDAADLALALTLKQFNILHPLKLNLKKEAANLGEATRVGQYLADIIKFTLSRISPEKRLDSMNKVIRKIYLLNENELSNKNMPATSSMGQAITFVKHVLFAHDPQYIRTVINSIVAYLR